MPDALYPAGLPLPLHEGYGFRPVSPLVRTPMVSGRARVRRGYTATPTQVALIWLMTDAQAQLFEKWYQEELLDGSSWFLARLKTPLGIDYYRSRFVDIYEGPVLQGGRYWRFTATLELYRRPLLADGSAAYPDAILHADIVDLAANREWPEA